jgi:hypothetical protein
VRIRRGVSTADTARLQSEASGYRPRLDGIFEVFNLFNHANYGSDVTNESSPVFGRPSFSDSLGYQPRMLQLGFRTTF